MVKISDQALINKIRPAKTARGKRVLVKREPQLTEQVKHAILCRCSTANQQMLQLLKDFTSLKKPNATFLSRKEEWKLFENTSDIEYVARKSDASLFAYASHSKKRPNNLILGRLYDGQVLDMAEFAVENFKSLSEFNGSKAASGSKPILLFTGTMFDTVDDYQRLKSLLMDFFVGPHVDQINLLGLEHVIHFVEVDGLIHMRSYRVALLKSGLKVPRVEVEEMGPRLDLTLRRTKFASIDLFKKALKQPDQVLKQQGKLKRPEAKNISKDAFGSTLGRIHMERQDYSELRLRKGGAYKARVA